MTLNKLLIIMIILLDEIQLNHYDGNPLHLYAVVDESELYYLKHNYVEV